MSKKYIGESLWHDEEDLNGGIVNESVIRLTSFGICFDLRIVICTELPTKGRSNILYFVAKERLGGRFLDPVPEVIGHYFAEYIWLQDNFVLIGALEGIDV